MSTMLDPGRARRALSGVRTEPIVDEETSVAVYAAGVWGCLAEPGDGTAGALVAALGPVAALRDALVGTPRPGTAHAAGLTVDALREGIARWRPRLVEAHVDTAFARAGRVGARLLTPRDAAWPAALRDLGAHAPLCLWVRGRAAALGGGDPALALVGARAATAYGEHAAMELSNELSLRGITIVSGAAYGIDAAAHRAALVADGTTVALVAGGVDRPYPAGHVRLLDRIADGGAIVSEAPCGSAPTKWRFLQRNRLIAALAGATVVVEAGWRSGSLNTAGHAAALGRPLGAVPGPITSAASVGCHRLLREFDARCVTTADEAAELLGLDALEPPASPDGPRTDDLTRVADALSMRAWRSVDEIARHSGMAVDAVRSHLGIMLLGGSVDSDGARWRLTTRG